MAGDQRFTKRGTGLDDLDLAWADRLDDAEVLRNAGRHASAIVMGLFAVEIALKTRICRKLSVKHLPKAFEIHDLDGLLLLAGLSSRILLKRASRVRENWDFIVKTSDQLNEMRYTPNRKWSQSDSDTFFVMLRNPPDGLLPWLARQR